MFKIMLLLIDLLDCKISKLGTEYVGNEATTKSRRICQQWAATYPHYHQYTQAYFPYDGPWGPGNRCRNPDNEPEGPWCYTMDPNVRWEYCDVPMCPGKFREICNVVVFVWRKFNS